MHTFQVTYESPLPRTKELTNYGPQILINAPCTLQIDGGGQGLPPRFIYLWFVFGGGFGVFFFGIYIYLLFGMQMTANPHYS